MRTWGDTRALSWTVVLLIVGVFLVGIALGISVGIGPLDDVAERPITSPEAQPPDPTQTPAPPGPATNEPTEGPPDKATVSPIELPNNPWKKDPVVVTLKNQADPNDDVEASLEDALEYWQVNDDQYGTYQTNFVFRADATDPDVVVWYNETISCNQNVHVLGCAPVLSADSRIQRPVEVHLKHTDSLNYRLSEVVIRHEFGHVLGLGHCDEPSWIMGAACSNRTLSGPDTDERNYAWLGSDLRIRIDMTGIDREERVETREEIEHAFTYYENGAEGEVWDNVTITTTDSEWEADIVLRFVNNDSCEGESVVCSQSQGRDWDNDGVHEYFAQSVITIEGVPIETRAWYAGAGMGLVLSPDQTPPAFEDGSYQKATSRWWTRK